ncbi:MAG TPA: hypothetical protein VK870_12870 [Ignavibacteriaceae bacterium]|nr:hypothetical protein [Ignavibacteriaceae bacterium]
MLEFISDKHIKTYYDFDLIEKERLIVNWQPIFEQLFIDLKKEIPASEISAKFHNTLAEIIATLTKRTAQKNVLLTGGCFQNVFLMEKTIDRLTENGFIPHWNQKIPTNDGGISFGQAVFANHFIVKSKQSKLVKTELERV